MLIYFLMKNQKVVELYQTLQARFELCNDSSQKSNSVIQLISAKCQQIKTKLEQSGF